MIRLALIAWSGVESVNMHRQRSIITVVCLVVTLLPYACGIGLSRGVRQRAATTIAFGADLYVVGRSFGKVAPVQLQTADWIRSVPGVELVVPRIVGQLELGRERIAAVVVGVSEGLMTKSVAIAEGRLPRESNVNELAVGPGLARRLSWKIGSVVPPFYRNDQGERLSKVVGLFSAVAPWWETNVILTTFKTAAHIFAEPDRATDVLVYCKAGYAAEVLTKILQKTAATRSAAALDVTSKQALQGAVSASLGNRDGLFNLLFVFLFTSCILVLIVTSGIGSTDRQREVGILKATGWQTDEVLLRTFAESCCLSMIGASTAIVLSFTWVRVLGGVGMSSVFLPAWRQEGVTIPFSLSLGSFLLIQSIAFVVVVSGTLITTWRTAATMPYQTLRKA